MHNRLFWLTALFAAEILAIVLVFQVFSSVECRLTDIETACRGLRGAMIRGLCIFVATGLFLWVRPSLRHQLARAANRDDAHRLWALTHFAGLGVIFVPWMAADPATLNTNFSTYFVTLSLGATLAGVGGLLWLIPTHHLRDWLKQGGGALALVIVVAGFIPDLAVALDPLWWSFKGLLFATFYGVAILLALLGNHVYLNPEASTIGTGDFVVEMAGSCSGIEGFALITGFLAIYAILMRETLHQRRFWLLVFPAALLASWLFNLIRIAALILIGDRVSPDLAVNGFHSFAGWLFFTLLALGVLWVVQVLPGLHRAEPAPKPESPLSKDPVAARIVPFLVFMLSGLLVQTFWLWPELGYPVQVALMALALWVFRRPILALDLRLDPLAIGVGGIVGGVWLATAPDSAPLGGLATLGTMGLGLWIICRLIGTVLLVPVIEELFFRGYLLSLINNGKTYRTVFGVVITSAAFAALHGRVFEAGLAGVAFALLRLRKGRLGDAILAHVVANAIIAIAALLSGDWELI